VTGGQEQHAIRARGRAATKECRERLALLGIDHGGKGLTVSFFAQVPTGCPGELMVGGDAAGLRHAGQAEVGGVRQHRGEYHTRVIGGQAGAQMVEL
jgi:hypothetical protein